MSFMQSLKTVAFKDLKVPDAPLKPDEVLEFFYNDARARALVIDMDPVIVRVLASSKACDPKTKVALDITLAPGTFRDQVEKIVELPLGNHPRVPLHRHEAALKTLGIGSSGSFINLFGYGELLLPPRELYEENLEAARPFDCTDPNYWHKPTLKTQFSTCLTVTSRERFDGPNSKWRPTLNLVTRDGGLERVLEWLRNYS